MQIKWFKDSPDAGLPECIFCSLCGKAIKEEQLPVRLWRGELEARFHAECFGAEGLVAVSFSKPRPVREVGIQRVFKYGRTIAMHATPDALSEFAEFGYIGRDPGSSVAYLCVDTRYDFEEVVAYIRNYGATETGTVVPFEQIG